MSIRSICTKITTIEFKIAKNSLDEDCELLRQIINKAENVIISKKDSLEDAIRYITIEIELDDSSDEDYELLRTIFNKAENIIINNQEPLRDAIKYKDEKMLEMLFEIGKVDKNSIKEYSECVLYNERILKMFIEAGAEINNSYYSSEYLRLAVGYGNPEKEGFFYGHCTYYGKRKEGRCCDFGGKFRSGFGWRTVYCRKNQGD